MQLKIVRFQSVPSFWQKLRKLFGLGNGLTDFDLHLGKSSCTPDADTLVTGVGVAEAVSATAFSAFPSLFFASSDLIV